MTQRDDAEGALSYIDSGALSQTAGEEGDDRENEPEDETAQGDDAEDGTEDDGETGEDGEGEGEDDDLDLGDDDDDDQSDDDEYVEFEEGGKKYKVPKALEGHLMRNADYTRKRQADAEYRKELDQELEGIEARKEHLKHQADFQHKYISEFSQLQSIDAQLKDYESIDWRKWDQQDPLQSQSAFRDMQMLKDRRGSMIQELQGKEQEFRQNLEKETRESQQKRETEAAKRGENTINELMRDNSWSIDTVKSVGNYAIEQGYTPEQVKGIARAGDKKAFELIHKAMRYDQAIAKRAAKQSKTSKQQTSEPVTKVKKGKTRAASAGPSDRQSTEEWVRRRNEQVRKKRAG